MLLDTEGARSTTYYAAWAADAEPERLPLAAAMAKAWASDAGRAVTGAAIQLHGGVGFTWEADVHWLFKRAQLDAAFLGRRGRPPRARGAARVRPSGRRRSDERGGPARRRRTASPLLTLNRPDRLNAWTGEMEEQYFAALEECGASEDVRVIVVTGAGRGFCAGADMQWLQSIGEGTVDEGEAQRERRPQSFPHTIPKPVIAAINGAVRGHRPRRRADVRHPLRGRGGEDHDRLRAPWPRGRVRDRLDPAAPGRAGARARPAALGARRPRRGGGAAGSRQPSDHRRTGCSRRRWPTRATSPSTAPRRAWRR